MRLAGNQEFTLGREVAIDGRALDASTLGNRADRGMRRPQFRMQLHGSLGDPATCLFLAFSTPLEPIGTLHFALHSCKMNLDNHEQFRYSLFHDTSSLHE